jgi:A/G-specific adenine glycosylase
VAGPSLTDLSGTTSAAAAINGSKPRTVRADPGACSGYRGPVISPACARTVVSSVLAWYRLNRRDLPWRSADATPWGILVSEFMLQQTPVRRVVDPWVAWLTRWPTPGALALEPPGEAVRAWGRLGYPRRALRLHQTSRAIVERHGGQVPEDHTALLALPGIGSYTAAAVASFAFGSRHVVLDTNVRRVLTRIGLGLEFPAPSLTSAEVALAETFLPRQPARAATWAAASMELGAVICTARTPRCDACPVQARCAWQRAGRPPHAGQPRRGQGYAGTDRQCRGAALQVLRSAGAIREVEVIPDWPDTAQRDRALASLAADGLVVRREPGLLSLP